MDKEVELEICGNCKREILQSNYVMHTAHCARNITLCPDCKEPIPKNQFDKHKEKHKGRNVTKVEEINFPRHISKTVSSPQRVPKETAKHVSSSNTSSISRINDASTFKSQNYTSDIKKVREQRINRTSPPFALKEPPVSKAKPKKEKSEDRSTTEANASYVPVKPKTDSLLPCKFCDLELPKLELEGHEDYCGARTDKCNICGEIVMFKYKKLHEDSNHGFLKLNDEPGPRPSWDSNTERPAEPSYIRRQRPEPIYTVNSFDFSPLYNSYSASSVTSENDKKESYKDISRRLDCKTEYIRNLLHDSASITVPLRRCGTVPRNHFNHNKGQAPEPPRRKRNPPTELVIPCEFCDTPIPHEDLIQHETGCRPDLARLNPRRRSPSPDDYFTAPEPTSPDVELPCEFCADMIPASQLLRHQLTCN